MEHACSLLLTLLPSSHPLALALRCTLPSYFEVAVTVQEGFLFWLCFDCGGPNFSSIVGRVRFQSTVRAVSLAGGRSSTAACLHVNYLPTNYPRSYGAGR